LAFASGNPCSKEALTDCCGWREGPLAIIEKPLAGRRIVVTRAPEQSRELSEALAELGAEVLSLPTVCFGPADDWTSLDRALRAISQFDWLLFTSQNAVRFFCQRFRELDISTEGLALSGLRVGAVGPATAQAVEREGMRVKFAAKEHGGEGLVNELHAELQGSRVLLPRSDRADDRLPKALRNAGAIVTEAEAYRTMQPATLDADVLAKLRGAEVDAIIFASPSAFYNLRDVLTADEAAELSAHVQFVAIGPTTARALRESGVSVGLESEESTAAGLATAIASHYQGRSSEARRS
jgi:uroporphyrinogen III methyltransferase/synthase